MEVSKLYRIEKLIYVKISDNHIPYIKGLVVRGPKGGKYCLDEFNIGILALHIYNMNSGQTTLAVNRLLREIGDRKLPVEFISNPDTSIRRFGTPLYRKSGMEYTKKIAKDVVI